MVLSLPHCTHISQKSTHPASAASQPGQQKSSHERGEDGFVRTERCRKHTPHSYGCLGYQKQNTRFLFRSCHSPSYTSIESVHLTTCTCTCKNIQCFAGWLTRRSRQQAGGRCHHYEFYSSLWTTDLQGTVLHAPDPPLIYTCTWQLCWHNNC